MRRRIVDVTALHRVDPKLQAALHPLAKDCVIRTPGALLKCQSWLGSDTYSVDVEYALSAEADEVLRAFAWPDATLSCLTGCLAGCAMVDDLRYYSALLYELEEQDEDSDIAKGRPERQSTSTSQQYASTRSGRKHRAANYRDETTDDEDGLRLVSHRVQKFVNGRKETIRAMQKVRNVTRSSQMGLIVSRVGKRRLRYRSLATPRVLKQAQVRCEGAQGAGDARKEA